MRTIFAFKNKKLFSVNYMVPIDVGDIVEHTEHNENSVIYKVTGRQFNPN
ncbi:MAG: hypothetical protein WC998_07510 [Candidatus Paceibacterota bacterium]|jgi:hypothetical protein